MIMPIDIEKKEFTRDKRGYNSREVDEFLDLISVDYEKVLSDNRNMAHKIKFLEKQLEESQKSDTAMLDTLETAKRLMADISASAERRAELMMRDAELEAENMTLEAKTDLKKLKEEHALISDKVKTLRAKLRTMLEAELAVLDENEAEITAALDGNEISEIEKEFGKTLSTTAAEVSQDTIVIVKEEQAPVEEPAQVAETVESEEPVQIDVAQLDSAQVETPREEGITEETLAKDLAEAPFDPTRATVSDLSESLKQMAEQAGQIDDTIILK